MENGTVELNTKSPIPIYFTASPIIRPKLFICLLTNSWHSCSTLWVGRLSLWPFRLAQYVNEIWFVLSANGIKFISSWKCHFCFPLPVSFCSIYLTSPFRASIPALVGSAATMITFPHPNYIHLFHITCSLCCIYSPCVSPVLCRFVFCLRAKRSTDYPSVLVFFVFDSCPFSSTLSLPVPWWICLSSSDCTFESICLVR